MNEFLALFLFFFSAINIGLFGLTGLGVSLFFILIVGGLYFLNSLGNSISANRNVSIQCVPNKKEIEAIYREDSERIEYPDDQTADPTDADLIEFSI